MRKLLAISVMFFATASLYAQDKAITTFILVRHAEKDLTQSTSDPDLSAEGKARALNLVNMLKQTEIHAVYSTDYKRTRQTVEPVAASKSLPIASYDPRKDTEIDAMLQKHAGGIVLVVGHSNTIPAFANYLIGEEKYKPMGDGEYGNVIVVMITEKGRNAKVVWLNY
jgi:2,3-bisphosphoglycerate-dependent phosphoglycerate mutase